MAKVIPVRFTNIPQNAEDTVRELTAEVQNMAGGKEMRVANPIHDPDTNRLVSIDFILPDTAAEDAKTAIADHNGVVGDPVIIPPNATFEDLDPTTGAAFAQLLEFDSGPAQRARGIITILSAGSVSFPAGFGPGTVSLGRVEGGAAGNVYVDLKVASGPGNPLFMQINSAFNLGATQAIVLADGELVLKSLGGTLLPIIWKNGTFTVPEDGVQECWIDADGKCYPSRTLLSGSDIGNINTYDQAVREGQL